MISSEEAKQIIASEVFPLKPVMQKLGHAAGKILAADVYANIDMPSYNQSSMDGYAFLFEGWQKYQVLNIAGEMAAGSNEVINLLPENAVRIFTGAAVPDGADTVVMQEKVTIENGKLFIHDENILKGINVRLQGAEIKSGDLALPAGTFMSPAAIGYLAGLGNAELLVYPDPFISIIVTGKELQHPGKPLQFGQVYESNAAMLSAALQQFGINETKIFWADDDLEILKKNLQVALIESDIVLLTGGVSVGDYDFVLQAAEECGIQKLFHKIKQRPGKPLYFGKKEAQLVFGLPGNPSSVLTCFYEYVIPALQKLTKQNKGLTLLHVPLSKEISKPAGLTHFLKGFFDGEKVMPLNAQESYRLSSFATANCLICLSEQTTICKAGEIVEIHLLPS